MSVGVVVLIIWLIRLGLSQKSGGGSSTNTANSPPAAIFIWVWLACFTIQVLTSTLGMGESNKLFFLILTLLELLVFLFVLFPSFFAQITIRLGWVKSSFWLGRAALFVHRNDPVGGAFFYAWQALQKAKPATQETLREWLQLKLANHKKTLGSGAMLMHALLKADTLDDDALFKHFKFLQGANRNWIPHNLARFLFRYLLARACAKKDWGKIGELARYWQGICWNPLANWVNLRHWTHTAKRKSFSVKIDIYWNYLCSGFPSLNRYLPLLSQYASTEEEFKAPRNLKELKLAEFKFFQHPQNDYSVLNKAWQDYFAKAAQAEWFERIKAVGCFNDEEVYLRLQTSVRDQISIRSGEDDLSSELAMQERDRQFNLLSIKIRALNTRTQQKKVMTGIQEYEEFLALIRIAEQLSKDDYTRSQVFLQMRSPCWNWVVELWNNQKNKPLAFLVCNYMAPLASEFGDSDGYLFFNGIVSNRFK